MADDLVELYLDAARAAQALLPFARAYASATIRLAEAQLQANMNFRARTAEERESVVGICTALASKMTHAEVQNANQLVADVEVAVFQTATRAALVVKTAREAPPEPVARLESWDDPPRDTRRRIVDEK